MFKTATFGLVATLILIAGSIGCSRDDNNPPPDNVAECIANEPSNFVENTPHPANEPATAPTTGNAPATGPTGNGADNGAALPPDNGAGNSASNIADNSAGNGAGLGTDTTTEKTYIVKAGDNFTTIAKEQYGDGTKAGLIAKANPNLDPVKLKIGAKVIIPPLLNAGTPPVTNPGDTAGETYTVKAGDNFTTIAKEKYGDGTKAGLIAKANPNLDPVKLKIGAKVIIPPLPPDTGGSPDSTTRPSPKTPPTGKKPPEDDSPPRPHFR